MSCINFVVLESLLLHTKFQGNCSSGSVEDFNKDLRIAVTMTI